MNGTMVLVIFIASILVNDVRCTDSIPNYYLLANGSYTSSANINIEGRLTTSSANLEVGKSIGNDYILGLRAELGQVSEYTARIRNLHSFQLHFRKYIPIGNNIAFFTGLNFGIGFGKETPLDFIAKSKFIFLESGVKIDINRILFLQLRALQLGFLYRKVEKQFAVPIKGFVLNDDESFPLQFGLGMRF
jgi:hypothetical protein